LLQEIREGNQRKLPHEEIILKPKLIIRRSCGATSSQAKQTTVNPSKENFEEIESKCASN